MRIRTAWNPTLWSGDRLQDETELSKMSTVSTLNSRSSPRGLT